MITSLILAFLLPLYIVLGASVGVPYAALSGDPTILFWLGRLGVRIGFAIARIRIRVHGWDPNPAEPPHVIYMMNHSSNLDVPAVFLYLPGNVRVLGKKELFKLPILGKVMKMGGFVPVDRSNREMAIASIRNAADVARKGASFLIAPEGTRSRTGKLLPFKKGAFHMAIESGVPIQPITVTGVFELMPPGSPAIRPGTMDIYFHEPVATADVDIKDRQKLMQRVWDTIDSVLDTETVVVES